jgi:hypothetical protein
VWWDSRPDRFTPGEWARDTHFIGGSWPMRAMWMQRRRKESQALLGIDSRFAGRPFHSRSTIAWNRLGRWMTDGLGFEKRNWFRLFSRRTSVCSCWEKAWEVSESSRHR